MKTIILILIACFLIAGCALRYDERLIGTWKSDREKTVSDFYKRFPSRFENNPEKKERFAEMFGHLIHSYTPTEIITGYGGETSAMKYSVVKKAENFVIINIYCSECDNEERRITFEDNFQSYSLDENWGIKEYFKKVQ